MNSSVTNNRHSVCFKELQSNISSPENKIIALDITNVLLEKYPNDKKGRTFLERANHYNQDVYLSDDENGGVRVDLVDRMANKHPLRALYNDTYIGTYTQPEQFTMDDILEKYNGNEINEKFRVRSKIENIFTSILLTILIIFFGVRLHDKAKQKIAVKEATTELVTKNKLI